MSQWATLAASHIRTDPEGSGGESHIMVAEDRGAHTVFSYFCIVPSIVRELFQIKVIKLLKCSCLDVTY